jgi:hypothetical protein
MSGISGVADLHLSQLGDISPDKPMNRTSINTPTLNTGPPTPTPTLNTGTPPDKS